MPLNAAQRAQLHAALTAAFEPSDLARLSSIYLGVELHRIARLDPTTATVTDMIGWAGRNGRLRDLVEGACADSAEQGQNPLMRALCAEAPGWDLESPWEPVESGPPPVQPARPAPRWPVFVLPDRQPGLVMGRDGLLAVLVARLTEGEARALALEGTGGVGKSTLALKLAYDPQVRAHFTGGVLWAGLGAGAQGDGRDAAVAAVQVAWADKVGADLSGAAGAEQQQALLAAAVGERRVLVVLDDAWDAEAADALRVPMPGVTHLLTTRDADIALAFAGDEANAIRLDVLEDATAWALFKRLAPGAPDAARRLAQAAGGLPLAVELLAGNLGPARAARAAVFAGQAAPALDALADPARRLALAQERLGSGGQQVSLEQVVELSVEGLRRTHPAAVEAFCALGAFAPRPATFDLDAAREVAGTDADTLVLLHTRNLVEAGDALALHQVIADYARARTPPDAVLRHRAHYFALANRDRKDWRTIEAAYDQIAHAWSALPDDGDALRAYYYALRVYFNVRGLHTTQIAWIERALAATEEAGERGTLLNNMAYCHNLLGEQARALEHYEQALPLRRQVGDRRGEAATLHNIGAVYSALGKKGRALEYLEQALPLRRQVGDHRSEAWTFNNIGAVYADLGEKARALEYFEQALPLMRDTEDRNGEAMVLNNIGRVYDDLGEQARALEYFEQALPLMRQVGDRRGEAATLNNIGGIHYSLGEPQRALEYLGQVLVLQQQIGDRWGEALTHFNIAMTAAGMGDLDRAVRELEQVIALDEALGHPDLARDRAALEAMRARRAAAGGGS